MEIISRIVKDVSLAFTVVPHNEGLHSHHLEVGPLPSDFVFTSIPGPFFSADKELVHPRKLVEVFKFICGFYLCCLPFTGSLCIYPLSW